MYERGSDSPQSDVRIHRDVLADITNAPFSDSDGAVWYFSFGSNMSPATLAARGVTPLESRKACVCDHRLVFNHRGIHGLEPVFANIRPHKGSTVHGVAHRMLPADMLKLDIFEGEGRVYERRTFPARTTEDGSFVQVHAYTSYEHSMVSDEERSQFPEYYLPSVRYMERLIDGARTHQLPQSFVDELTNQATFVLPKRDPYMHPNSEQLPLMTADQIAQMNAQMPGRRKLVAVLSYVFDCGNDTVPRLYEMNPSDDASVNIMCLLCRSATEHPQKAEHMNERQRMYADALLWSFVDSGCTVVARYLNGKYSVFRD
jgi:hypothetical protein